MTFGSTPPRGLSEMAAQKAPMSLQNVLQLLSKDLLLKQCHVSQEMPAPED